jgi:hypothetical protein
MSGPRVTDHAVLQYLERAQGVDVESIRRHIENVCRNGKGARSVLAEGFCFVMRAEAVVTVYKPARGRHVEHDRVVGAPAE